MRKVWLSRYSVAYLSHGLRLVRLLLVWLLLLLVWLLLIRLLLIRHLLLGGILIDYRLHFDLLLSGTPCGRRSTKLGVADRKTVAVEVDSYKGRDVRVPVD
jgi:hypothetical protein